MLFASTLQALGCLGGEGAFLLLKKGRKTACGNTRGPRVPVCQVSAQICPSHVCLAVLFPSTHNQEKEKKRERRS